MVSLVLRTNLINQCEETNKFTFFRTRVDIHWPGSSLLSQFNRSFLVLFKIQS